MTQRECEQIELFLMRFFDNELTGEEFQRVQTHLRSCPDCTAALEEYEKVRHLIRTTLTSETEKESFGHFGEEVMNRLRRETFPEKPDRTGGFKRLLYPSGVVAGTLALAAAILLWVNFSDQGALQTSTPSGILEARQQEMERLQGELGLSIRDYAFLKYNLVDRHRTFEETLARLEASASQYPDRGTYQEDLGRTIRDYAFVFYQVRRLGEGEQEKMGEKIRDMARLRFISRTEYL